MTTAWLLSILAVCMAAAFWSGVWFGRRWSEDEAYDLAQGQLDPIDLDENRGA